GVLCLQALGSPLRDRFNALLQLAAAGLETFDERARRFVEDARDLRGTTGQHGVEFAGAGLEGIDGLAGSLADMLVDGGEGLGDRIGRRDEVGLRLRELLANVLGKRFGTFAKPAFGILYAAADAGSDGTGARGEAAFYVAQRLADSLGPCSQFRRGLMRAGDDALIDLVEGLGDLLDASRKRGCAFVGASRDAAFDILEYPGDRLGAFRQRIGGFGNTCRDAAVDFVEPLGE